MFKEPWKNNIVDCLNDIAQGSVDSEENFITFDQTPIMLSELFCQLFDDTGLNSLLGKETVFSATVDALLAEIHDISDGLDFEESTKNILDTNEWGKIQVLAKKVLMEVNSVREG